MKTLRHHYLLMALGNALLFCGKQNGIEIPDSFKFINTSTENILVSVNKKNLEVKPGTIEGIPLNQKLSKVRNLKKVIIITIQGKEYYFEYPTYYCFDLIEDEKFSLITITAEDVLTSQEQLKDNKLNQAKIDYELHRLSFDHYKE